ncbi:MULTISPECIES: hypothetical protein [unclassified Bradyrhizobium]|uniref:hypothetical protein n=1 Tax=unclassified Bradyrhizobium TaxID=2631580 RepID=UPI0024E0C347|nr:MULTISPECIES: hypothetical protein [unclassified Bradyrhizobium]
MNAPNLVLDLFVESLEGFGAGKTVPGGLELSFGGEQGRCRYAVLMWMTLFGRQPVTQAGVVDGVLQRAQLAEFGEFAARSRPMLADIVIYDGLE